MTLVSFKDGKNQKIIIHHLLVREVGVEDGGAKSLHSWKSSRRNLFQKTEVKVLIWTLFHFLLISNLFHMENEGFGANETQLVKWLP